MLFNRISFCILPVIDDTITFTWVRKEVCTEQSTQVPHKTLVYVEEPVSAAWHSGRFLSFSLSLNMSPWKYRASNKAVRGDFVSVAQVRECEALLVCVCPCVCVHVWSEQTFYREPADACWVLSGLLCVLVCVVVTRCEEITDRKSFLSETTNKQVIHPCTTQRHSAQSQCNAALLRAALTKCQQSCNSVVKLWAKFVQ